jgi:hypothetical protein
MQAASKHLNHLFERIANALVLHRSKRIGSAPALVPH